MTSVRIRDAGDSPLFSRALPNYVSIVAVIFMAVIIPSEAINAEPPAPWIRPRNGDFEDFSAVISPSGFDYALYMERVIRPLQETELENILDLNDRYLARQYDFDPIHILTMMIDRAAAQNTAPEKFWEEIQDLMALLNRSTTEQTENFEGPAVSSTMTLEENPNSSTNDPNFDSLNHSWPPIAEEEPPTYYAELIINSTTERTTTLSTMWGWNSVEDGHATLLHLKKKYNVRSECFGPESITPFRLVLMFPHYLNLGQKPFVNTTYISVEKSGRFFYSTTPNYYGGSYRRRATTTVSYERNDQTTVQVPSFFGHHEFGGLIPRSGNLDETARNYIIAIHLYTLYRDEDEKCASVPFRTKCVMVKWRMDRSLVSDDRRIRFLENNDVITEDGQLKSEISKLYNDLVPSDFYNKIFWKVFRQ